MLRNGKSVLKPCMVAGWVETAGSDRSIVKNIY